MKLTAKRAELLLASGASLALFGCATHAQQPQSGGETAECEQLIGQLSNVLEIESATHVPAGETQVQTPVGGGRYMPVPATVPEHCAVTGQFEQRTGSDGMPYAFKVEMRLPLDWNGGLLYQGGGGLNGSVNPALGRVMSTSTVPGGLMRGFAVISTDGGHDAAVTPGASFARDQLAMLNFAYASIGKVAHVGKSVVDGFYGRQPDRTYFWGCSNGGREALIAAQRFPQEFDGIIAMNPGFELSRATMLAHYSTLQYRGLGRPGEPGAITLEDMQLLGNAVTQQCDALDGNADGLIFNHAACDFDPAVVQCRPGQNDQCLSPEKVEVIRTAFAGPQGDNGEPVFGSWPWDSGIGTQGWLDWQNGRYIAETDAVMEYFPSLIRDGIANYFHYPPIAEEDLLGLDHTSLPEGMRVTAALTDSDSTQFSTFADRGGKMILMTGWADPIFSASRLTQWYEQVIGDAAAMGSDAQSFSRLFLNPGMNHCAGGPSLDQIDLLGALDSWVTQGTAPDRVIARGEFLEGQSRPLCQYPAYAHYSGEGDAADAANYECRLPQG